MNDFQKQRFVERVIEAMFGTIKGKRISILGFAFKKDTGDTRETPAIDVCKVWQSGLFELLTDNSECLLVCARTQP